mgnify:FL=1
MKLDPSCVRDLLLALEDCETINEQGVLSEDFSLNTLFRQSRLQKYDVAQLRYTFRMLVDAKYIACHINYIKGGYIPMFGVADGITYEGHQFIANIRNDGVWNKTIQKIAHVGGSVSMGILSSVSEGVAKALIDKLSLDQPSA